ncbi:MAG: hypothetical protein H8E37_05935 [Planctomycetes bacterium]|nr:hypothetical protein [Planctomycetota bacterium]
MHATELSRNLPDDWPGVIALVGDELALKSSTIELILKEVLPDEDDAPTRFPGKDTPMKNVRDELRTISMWSERRVAICEDAGGNVEGERPAAGKETGSPAKKARPFLTVKARAPTATSFIRHSQNGRVPQGEAS